VDVLALIHGEEVRPGVFAEVAQARGDRLEEWSTAWDEPLPRPLDAYDPLLGPLPERFDAFQWHYYTHDLPDGAVELARSPVCTQAYRLGDRVWGVQFHPEVTAAQVDSWIEDEQEIDGEALRTETAGRIEAWNGLGRDLCGRFLDLSADR
jgi:GMP synthase-like glutamine amidotransferase